MNKVITASIYSFQANPDFTNQYGVKMAFPISKSIIRTLGTPQNFQGVDCNSTIEVVCSMKNYPVYYASETASALINQADG